MTLRQSLSVQVERQLLRFYRRKTCVIYDVDADWHHLDENPANSAFENIIPLVHSLNIILDGHNRTKNESPLIYSADLLPTKLISQAELHFHEWNVAAAYGFARLAIFVGKKYAGASAQDIGQYAVRCLWYSRHRSEQLLFRDVLERDLIPLLSQHPMDQLTAITVIHECASMLSEFGKPHDANAALSHLDTMLPNWKQIVSCYPSRYAGLVRREGIIEIGIGSDSDRALGKLKESEQAAPASLSALVGAANARAWNSYIRDNYQSARDAIEPYRDLCLDRMLAGSIDPKPIAIPMAMVAELILIEYAARRASNESFTDQAGQKLLTALYGISNRADFSIPLITPSMGQSASLNSVLEEFRDRGAGDWARSDITESTLDAIRRAIGAVHV